MSGGLFPNGWLHDIREIRPGNSAILSGNKLTFYGIHGAGITTISISFISCIVVIVHILCGSLKKDKWDFSDRFPLYLAFADGIWAVANLSADHIVLVIKTTFPHKPLETLLSINLYFFLGYQQLMQGGLACYTYLKVVRRVSIDLGRYEWKLHLFVLSILAITVGIFLSVGAFGCSGYWFLADLNKTSGIIFASYICTSSTLHAMCTHLSYRAIKRVIDRQKRVVSSMPDEVGFKGTREHYHSTATNCLTTFVYISTCIYGPMAFAAWAFVIQSMFGFIEPFTALVVVIVANSSGWANAWGYFHNKKLKEMRRQAVPHSKATSYSTSSTN